jgi:hypothetical protein
MSPIPPDFIHDVQSVLGYFTIKSLVEGFEEKLGEEGAKGFIDVVKKVGGVVLSKIPRWPIDQEKMLKAAQESPEELQNTVDKALQDPSLKAEIKPLLAELAKVEQLVYKPQNSPTVILKDNAKLEIKYGKD